VINTLDIIWWSHNYIYSKPEICNICNIYRSQYRKLRDEYFRLHKNSDIYTKIELYEMFNNGEIEEYKLPQEMINEINIERNKGNTKYDNINKHGIKDQSGLHRIKNKSKLKNKGGYEILYPTNHVYQRLRERFNIVDGNEANNLINEALNDGYIYKQYKGNRYLIYGKYKFVIYNNSLITVYDRFETKNV